MEARNRANFSVRSHWAVATVLLISATTVACAPGGAAIHKNIKNPVSVSHSRSYSFDEVSVWREDGVLTISGRVFPRTFGQATGHVDVAIIGAHTNSYRGLSIPVRDRYYRGRWRGAYFKARLSFKVPGDARAHIALHDPQVRTGADGDLLHCPRNRALVIRKAVGHAQP